LTWDNFIRGFSRELAVAEDVFDQMIKNGLHDNCLTKMDFTFISDKKENLIQLSHFIKTHYPYIVEGIKEVENIWEINGVTNEIPLTKDNLAYWVLDMYKRGYEFDSSIDAYGGFGDSKGQTFPELTDDKASHYYNTGIDCYRKGNLSGAIFNLSLVVAITPNDQDAYYSRAIVKNELYTWKAALKDYDKAITVAPDFASALINRGVIKDENGDYIGAKEDYEKVFRLKNVEIENLQEAYFNLGNTKFNMNDCKGACDSWIKALELGAEYAEERIKDYCC